MVDWTPLSRSERGVSECVRLAVGWGIAEAMSTPSQLCEGCVEVQSTLDLPWVLILMLCIMTLPRGCLCRLPRAGGVAAAAGGCWVLLTRT